MEHGNINASKILAPTYVTITGVEAPIKFADHNGSTDSNDLRDAVDEGFFTPSDTEYLSGLYIGPELASPSNPVNNIRFNTYNNFPYYDEVIGIDVRIRGRTTSAPTGDYRIDFVPKFIGAVSNTASWTTSNIIDLSEVDDGGSAWTTSFANHRHSIFPGDNPWKTGLLGHSVGDSTDIQLNMTMEYPVGENIEISEMALEISGYYYGPECTLYTFAPSPASGDIPIYLQSKDLNSNRLRPVSDWINKGEPWNGS